jgi:hypothetical protein
MKHDYELEPHPDGRIYLNVDSHSMGVGGYDSWSPNVDSECLILNGNVYITKVTMKAIQSDCCINKLI